MRLEIATNFHDQWVILVLLLGGFQRPGEGALRLL